MSFMWCEGKSMVSKWIIIGNKEIRLPEHYNYQLIRALCFHRGTLDRYIDYKIYFCNQCGAVYDNK